MSVTDEPKPRREPVFNAPWPAAALALVMVGCFLLQEAVGPEAWVGYAFAPALLGTDGSWTMLTTQFLHGGWPHLLMNAVGALAFGAPVARLFGLTARGVAAFFIFYLLCGCLSIWGHGLLHAGSLEAVIGASGAVSGLMGAAGRLIDRRGRLGPIWSRTAIGFSVAWVAVNLIIAFVGFAPGLGEGRVAWEAHLIGFFAGLLLVGPFARLAGALNPATH